MRKDTHNDSRVKDKGDNMHRIVTSRAKQRVYFVDLTDELGPTFTKRFRI